MTLHEIASHALPADALCGLDEGECASVDRIARAIEASGYGEATAHRIAILRAIGAHLRATYTDAREALQWLATLDSRLATWGACACAREVLLYVPEGEERPLRAIEARERWLAGQATLDEVQMARTVTWAAWMGRSAYSDASYAVVAAVYSASADAVVAASAHAASAHASARRSAEAWNTAHNAELARLVGVVADALPGLPPEVTQ